MDKKPIWQSKTMIAAGLTAVLPHIVANSDTALGLVAALGVGGPWLLTGLGALFAALRYVTEHPVR
jgi:hypothetical protein